MKQPVPTEQQAHEQTQQVMENTGLRLDSVTDRRRLVDLLMERHEQDEAR
jgi:hypothetical protein